jgi:ribonuclease P protein component
VRREENVSAQQPAAQAHARVPGAHADAARAGSAVAAAAQGPQAAERLSAGSAAAEAQRPADERLRRGERVRRRGEYLRAYRRGRRRSGALVMLHFAPNADGVARLGVTVSRKVGNSVVRHRLKRRIVEIFRRAPARATLPAWDFVVHVKPEAAAADFAALRHEIEWLLRGAAEGRR